MSQQHSLCQSPHPRPPHPKVTPLKGRTPRRRSLLCNYGWPSESTPSWRDIQVDVKIYFMTMEEGGWDRVVRIIVYTGVGRWGTREGDVRR